ncbi:MAG: ribonuclease [Pseudomonadota bacterium]|nr:ribonuclease [Pseudomonadota bacterium]MDQ3228967.1 ribonuclease [Pseudomonadota bacterium]
MRKRNLVVVVVLLALAALFWPKTATEQVAMPASPDTTSPQIPFPPPAPRAADLLPAFLPREARETIAAIQRGGPYSHRQDGAVFGNREGRLPRRQRGFYREYTVDTPGVKHRGARRIVTGGNPPQVWYYTDNHYDSFRAFEVDAGLHAMERR